MAANTEKQIDRGTMTWRQQGRRIVLEHKEKKRGEHREKKSAHADFFLLDQLTHAFRPHPPSCLASATHMENRKRGGRTKALLG